MTRPTVPISVLDAQAESSGQADTWAEALSIAHEIARLEADLARVRLDVDRCPPTPCGRAFARRWLANTQRREHELQLARRTLDRLRRDCGTAIVASAVESAPASRGEWITVPGGSSADG